MSNHMFHTFATGRPEHRRQMVNYAGRATPINRLDLQRLMGQIGIPSSIIEVDGSMSKSKAYELASYSARKFGFPVITDKENLAHLKSINVEADKYKKYIIKATKAMDIPADLKSNLLESIDEAVEIWRGDKQEL